MKNKKSCGVDEINAIFLKKTKEALLDPLCTLMNISLAEGLFPNTLKKAKVIPIYKNKNLEVYSNYRPISLLPSISKILEKIIHKRLYNFLNLQNILHENQYGFRPKYSTTHAITHLSPELLNSLDNKKDAI